MFKVSVILATYNRAQTLRACIESVLNQDFHDFYEFIIINDGSTDESEVIIKDYSLNDAKIKYFAIPNGGQANALNLGLSKAQGEYVAFIDSDDEYHPNHISTLYEQATLKKCDFVLGSYELISFGKNPVVVDFYDRSKTIHLRDIECTTGLIFGRQDKIREAGGFQVGTDFPDTLLFDNMKKLNYRWHKCPIKTYKYHFGLCENNVSAKLLEKYL